MAQIEIIAEIANAHQGQPETALELALQCARSGADAVKFQVYTAEELLVSSHPRFEHFKKQSFPAATWEDILGKAIEACPSVYCDVFGTASLKVAHSAGVRKFKIHSSDLGNDHLLKLTAQLSDKTLLSAGGATVPEISHALSFFSGMEKGKVILMHGYQSFPTKVEDSSLERIDFLKSVFGDRCEYGYMDHVDGDDPFAMILPLMAVRDDVTTIEKHVTLDRAARGIDYYSSLEPEEFGRFVTLVRRAESAYGTQPHSFTASEKKYRTTMKKHWVAARDMDAGELLQGKDLVMKRVDGVDAAPLKLAQVVGRRLLNACEKDQLIRRNDVRQTVWALPVARFSSSRLPGKALIDAGGMPALVHLMKRLKQSKRLDNIVFCTTRQPEDDQLATLIGDMGIDVHRGQTDDVLARMLGAIKGHEVDVIVRITGDDILVDPDYIDQGIEYHLGNNFEYTDLKDLPSGTEGELFDARLLQDIKDNSNDSSGTEYLTFYVTRNGDQFARGSLPVDPAHLHDWRLTLDTTEDYEVIGSFLNAMREQGKQIDYRLDDIVDFFTRHPEQLAINAKVRQRTDPPNVDATINWRKLAAAIISD